MEEIQLVSRWSHHSCLLGSNIPPTWKWFVKTYSFYFFNCWLQEYLYTLYCNPTELCDDSSTTVFFLFVHIIFSVWKLFFCLTYGHILGGGHGKPLQYSCLENPEDREAWWATVHGISKSRTQVKWLITQAWTYPIFPLHSTNIH